MGTLSMLDKLNAKSAIGRGKRKPGRLSPLSINERELDDVTSNKILEQGMIETKRDVNEALFRLGQLLEDESKLYNVIEGGDPAGHPHVFELHAQLPLFFRIECKVGYCSPIIINLKDLNNKLDQIEDLIIYGSFNDRQPSKEKNQYIF